jgi:hydroxymethylbilane synthase
MGTTTPVRIATRGSALARWQAERVAARLHATGGVTCELVVVTTTGDARRDVPIHELGGTGVFVREVQQAVLEGRADLAVHSAKDLPSTTADGLLLACVPERADVRDALVGARLDTLRADDTVATGSVRRRAQLAAAVPGLRFAELRGNIDTRLAKAGDHTAIVVAVAALERLGLAESITDRLPVEVMLPQVGQGALAIECRADDRATQELLAALDDGAAHRAVHAERAFLAGIGGGCDAPVGALASSHDDGTLVLDALVADRSGRLHRTNVTGDDPDDVGARAASALAPEWQR